MESEVTCKILCVELATDVVARSQTIFVQQRYLSGPTMQPSSWGWKQNGIIWDHGSVSGPFLWNHSETWQLLVCIKFEAGTSIQIHIINHNHTSNTSTQTYAISSGMHAGSSLSQAFSGHWTFSDRNPGSKWKASILHHRGRKSCRSNTSRIVRKPASAEPNFCAALFAAATSGLVAHKTAETCWTPKSPKTSRAVQSGTYDPISLHEHALTCINMH